MPTATKADVGKDLDDMSTRISTLVRVSAAAVLAVSWGFLVMPNDRIHLWPWAVMLAMALAFVALALDWAQYVVGYLNGRSTWDAMEKDETLRGWTRGRLYSLRGYIFGAKQVVAFLGVAVLTVAMVPEIIRLASQ